jgi:GR25 family glycosyltransferase involved in LPS biosynthesis
MIYVVFHVACMGSDWKTIFEEIFSEIISAGLYHKAAEIHIGVLGSTQDFYELSNRCEQFEKVRLHHWGDNFEEYEFPSVQLAKNLAGSNATGKVLYCHTKGVSKNYGNPIWKYWRRYMIKSCIREHAKHLSALQMHDVSGDMWTNDTHFSGNFWWANAGHLVKLPDLDVLRQSPKMIWEGHSYQENLRLQCEMWLGMTKGIRVMEHGVLNMTPGFEYRVVPPTDEYACPLNEMKFDRIYVINLDKRIDRYKSFQNEAQKIGLENVVRFPAINAKELGFTKRDLDNPGLIGCFMSHYFILQEAVINNYERVLIFEDDATFVEGFNERLTYSLQELPADWELVYLGYTERYGLHTYKSRIAESITIPNDPWGTQAYMLQGAGIRIMYENLKEIRDHIDIQMSRYICNKLKAYEIFPTLCPQSGAQSDISIPMVRFRIPQRGRTVAFMN